MPLIAPQDSEVWAMTPAQAVEALKRPLKFGDAAQIKALAILEEVESAVQAILKCEHDYEDRTKLCSCLAGFTIETLRAAVEDKRARSWRDDASSIKSCIGRKG